MAQVMYGFINLEDYFDANVFPDRIEATGQAIDATVAEHNRQMNALLNLFATRTTEYKLKFRSPTLARLQPLDQDGRARKIRVAGQYELGLPLQEAGIAWGANWRGRRKMTVAQANDLTATMLLADTLWMRDHLLVPLFDNVGFTFADPEHGNLAVKGLANGDATEYLIQSGSGSGTTDNHYYAQAAAISDAANPLPTIVTELKEHPENAGEVIILHATNLKASIQGLTGFLATPDANIREGINTRLLVGSPGSVQVPGEFYGYHDSGVWLSEWSGLPSGYGIALMTGGERPVAIREDEDTGLRGFIKVGEREDYPFWEAQYLRIAGFGAWNRVGAVVFQIGSGSYSIPTNYSPLMS